MAAAALKGNSALSPLKKQMQRITQPSNPITPPPFHGKHSTLLLAQVRLQGFGYLTVRLELQAGQQPPAGPPTFWPNRQS